MTNRLYFSWDAFLRTFGSCYSGTFDKDDDSGKTQQAACTDFKRGADICAMHNFFRGYRFFCWCVKHVWSERLRNPELQSALPVVAKDLEEFLSTVITNVELRPPSDCDFNLLAVSPYLQFVHAVKEVFLAEFEKYKADFPDVDVIRFFTACVVQPVSWYQTNCIFHDPMCISSVDVEHLLVQRSIVQLMRAGFTSPVPGANHIFGHRFYKCSHPFFRDVYRFACTVNRKMAQHMSVCCV